MFLQELFLKKYINNLDKSANPDDEDVGMRMSPLFKKYGWKLLGSGTEGAVGEHPNKNLALKIFLKSSAYKVFVDLVKQHQHNPHFPVFAKYVKEVPGTQFSYVLVEKLKKISEAALWKNYVPEMYVLDVEGKLNGEDTYTIEEYGKSYLKKDLIRYLESQRESENPYNDSVWKTLGRKPDAQWFEAAKLVYGSAKDLTADLHDENFMLRGKTLVFIDPFY